MIFKKSITSELLSTGGYYLTHWTSDAQKRQLHSDLSSILNSKLYIPLRTQYIISRQIENELIQHRYEFNKTTR